MSNLFDDPEIASGSSDLDDYDIEREIGRGGDGVVYLARDKKVGRQVAIKLLHTGRGPDEKLEERFRAEAESIASLDHPNIIPVYANGEMEGRAFYTMKYVSGGSLASRMTEFSDPRVAVELLIKIADAIHHAHQRGILHRDLKPSNILLDEDGEPYLSDFGLAKRHDRSLHLTLSGSVMGTPSYMSPEQASGDNAQVTITSDIFSLGSICYELLTGELAFGGGSSHAILKNVIESDVSFPRKNSRSVNRDLETICLKCLEKLPAKRYSSALAFAEDLERWKIGKPVHARRITLVERMVRWVFRYPIPSIAVAVALLSLIVGTIISATLWRDSEIAQSESEQARLAAEDAREAAEENAYFAHIADAMSARQEFNFGQARRLLANARSEYRGTEWRLLNGLSRGDQRWTTRLGDARAINFTFDSSRNRILFLTEDRNYYQVDPEIGQLMHVGVLPDPPPDPLDDSPTPRLGLRQFFFSPDGKHYAFLDADQLFIVSVENQTLVAQKKAHPGAFICWLDSQRLLQAVGAREAPLKLTRDLYPLSAWIYHLDRRRITNLPPLGCSGPVLVSEDGEWVAAARGRHSVDVRKISDNFQGQPIFRCYDGHGHVHRIAFSPDKRFLAVSWLGATTRHEIFELPNGDLIATREVPGETEMAFTAESDALIIAGDNPWVTTIHFLEQKNPKAMFDDGHPRSTNFEVGGPFSPPQRLLTRRTSDRWLSFYFGHNSPSTVLLPLPKGGFLTAGKDQTLRRWAKPDLSAFRRSSLSTNDSSHHPVVSHSGDYLAYLGKNNRSQVWHRPSNTTVFLPQREVYLAVFDNGHVLTRIQEDDTVICRQVTMSGMLQEKWRHRPDEASSSKSVFIGSAVTPNERFVAVLQSDQLIVIDMKKGITSRILHQGETRGSKVGQSVAISGNGKWIAVTGFGGQDTCLFRTANSSVSHRLVPALSDSSKDQVCVFNHDGSRIFVGNGDGWIRVYDTETQKELSEESWRAHGAPVTALALSQAGDVIISSGGKSINLWSSQKEPHKERRLRLAINTGTISRNWLQFCAQDKLLLHSGPNQPIEIWSASGEIEVSNPPPPILPLPKPTEARRPIKQRSLFGDLLDWVR